MAILGRYSPLVESLSVDEAFVDCTGSVRLHGDGPTIARAIRAAVQAETGLTASVGVGPNKFVAKLATDARKPDGMTVAPTDGLAGWLAPFAIERMWGVGPRTLPRFHAAGIRTFGDLQRMDTAVVAARLGDHALAMRARALGHDDRPVEPEHERKGVGHETTFPEDLEQADDVLDALHDLTEGACLRLRAAGAVARRVTVKIRFGDFETVTRSSTLPEPTDRTLVLLAAAKELFRRWAAGGFVPVRLVGVRLECGDPGEGDQGLLFGDPRAERERAVDRVADAIAHRFGKDAIARGGQRRAGGQQSSPQSSE
jgi:DNA polymerase-4